MELRTSDTRVIGRRSIAGTIFIPYESTQYDLYAMFSLYQLAGLYHEGKPSADHSVDFCRTNGCRELCRERNERV